MSQLIKILIGSLTFFVLKKGKNMSTPQEILQEMITAAPAQSIAIGKSITQLTAQIADLQKKQDAMKEGVGDVIATNIESYLIGIKFTPTDDYFILKGTTFNEILTETGSITDWKIYHIETLVNLTFVDNITFECDNDKTSIFTIDKDVSFLLGTTRVYSTVLSSTYESDKTTVVLNDEVLTSELSSSWTLNYVYSAGNDTTIDEFKTNWDFTHDYIVNPLGTNGTYGTQDMIAKLNISLGILNSNKSKITNSETVFSNFV
ncbi:MAG: hypothetical protein WCZ11_03970 [Bacilli bacterium]